MKQIYLSLISLVLVFCSNAAFAGGGHDHGSHSEHGHDEHDNEPEKGPHGGRMLSKGDFSLEITIFENGVPPQFRVYPYHDEELVKPETVKAKIILTRFGNEKSDFELTPENDYLTSKNVVDEPHSFDVQVLAEFSGEAFTWNYDSYEGRTTLSDTALDIAKLEIETAGEHEISNVTRVFGRLIPNEDRVAHLVPRFPGVVREVKRSLGDKVSKGDVLAVVESNSAMQPYDVRSLVDGVVIKRHATLGEFVSENSELFVVADLSEIWADFQLYRDDFGPIEIGERITIDLGDDREIEAKVSYVSPVTDEATQSKLIRAVLPNPSGSLRPGLFISGILSKAHAVVPVAVKREAIQTFRDWEVVYLTNGHVFQAMPVELGKRDGKFVEILSGIKAGDRYVSKNSFVIKADIEKSGASHDH